MDALPSGPAGPSGRHDCAVVHCHLKAVANAFGALEPGDFAGVRRLLRGLASETRFAAGVTSRPAHGAPAPGTWLIPEDPDARYRIVYCHGLSFMAGDLATYGGFASRLAAATRASTMLVEYRLTPEHTFPAAHDDCSAALQWAQSHGPDGKAPAHCVVAGDSCGASLALTSALDAIRAGKPVAALILFSPFVDLSVAGESWLRNEGRDPILTADLARGCAALYAPGVDPRDQRLSPVFADLAGLPPVQIHASAADPMFDDAMQLMSACNRAGVAAELHAWGDIPHAWYLFHDQLKQARHSINLAGSFVRRL